MVLTTRLLCESRIFRIRIIYYSKETDRQNIFRSRGHFLFRTRVETELDNIFIQTTMSSKGRSRKHRKIEYEDEQTACLSEVNSTNNEKQTPTNNTEEQPQMPNDDVNNATDSTNSEMELPKKAIQGRPKDWLEVYNNIKEMRKDKNAAVDSMGCERTMDPNCDEKTRRYQTLISLMLSSQTKDPVTYAAMDRLKEHGLTPQNILETDEDVLKGLIYPVGFYKRKAEYIKKTTKILVDEYNSDIPETIEGLLKLPGVGPKMGYICLNVAWGKNDGIGVDTHVHRICERLGWVGQKKGKQNTPEDTRKSLERWLPTDLWQEVNILLVGFGQTVCLPVKPKCQECLNLNICPVGKSSQKSKTKSK